MTTHSQPRLHATRRHLEAQMRERLEEMWRLIAEQKLDRASDAPPTPQEEEQEFLESQSWAFGEPMPF